MSTETLQPKHGLACGGDSGAVRIYDTGRWQRCTAGVRSMDFVKNRSYRYTTQSGFAVRGIP